jgi:arginine deiminase
VDKFLVHPIIFSDHNQFKIWELTFDHQQQINQQQINQPLQEYLQIILNRKILFIPCGRNQIDKQDLVFESREQWNDATNVFAIAPGVVIAYDRNDHTNELLLKNNIKVFTIPSSELSRGRGGPRCMTMPIFRDDLPK